MTIITEQLRTEPQRRERHRDFLAGPKSVSSLAILAGPPAAVPRRLIALIASLPRAGLWQLLSGRTVRACSDVVRVGWIAWQALVAGGAGHRLDGFSGGGTIGNDGDLRLLLTDNSYQAATGQATKARRHKGRTKTGLAILAGTPAAAPIARIASLLRAALLLLPAGRAV
jgi:hypothetical protein